MKITLRNQEFELRAERAIYWPAERVLFCSDLHWGREAYLQKKGFAVPEMNFEAEAEILKKCLEETGAKELWFLGDFIHHPEGLHSDLALRMTNWLRNITLELNLKAIRLIPGNHDKRFLDWSKQLPLIVHENGIVRGDFIFVHDERDIAGNDRNFFCFSGHLHPAFYPAILGSEKLPCFWIRENAAYLPAFSRMAGGMEIGRLKADDRVYVITDQQVIEV
jgi:DNA ligase-associated metallophosphoesterase